MTDSTSDRKEVRRKEKSAKLADTNRAAVVREIMSTQFGRQWVWTLLESCHCFTTTFNGDALQSAFLEGQRSIGLAILSDIMLTCPDQYIQAQRESNERNSANEQRGRPVTNGGDSGSDPATGDGNHDRLDIDIDFEPGSDLNNLH